MPNIPDILQPLSARGLLPTVLSILEEYHVTAEELMGNTRRRNVTAARHELWAFMNRRLSCEQIAGLWQVTHGAVSKAIRARQEARHAR